MALGAEAEGSVRRVGPARRFLWTARHEGARVLGGFGGRWAGPGSSSFGAVPTGAARRPLEPGGDTLLTEPPFLRQEEGSARP